MNQPSPDNLFRELDLSKLRFFAECWAGELAKYNLKPSQITLYPANILEEPKIKYLLVFSISGPSVTEPLPDSFFNDKIESDGYDYRGHALILLKHHLESPNVHLWRGCQFKHVYIATPGDDYLDEWSFLINETPEGVSEQYSCKLYGDGSNLSTPRNDVRTRGQIRWDRAIQKGRDMKQDNPDVTYDEIAADSILLTIWPTNKRPTHSTIVRRLQGKVCTKRGRREGR